MKKNIIGQACTIGCYAVAATYVAAIALKCTETIVESVVKIKHWKKVNEKLKKSETDAEEAESSSFVLIF